MFIFQETPSTYKKKNTKKKESFIIVNTDGSQGSVYIHNVINTLVNTGLQQQDIRFGGKHAKKIKFGDAIVVGDCNTAFDYDFRIVKDKHIDTLNELDGRKFKIYDVIEDYTKVINKIKSYAKTNRIGEYRYQQSRRSFGRKPIRTAPTQVNININCEEEPRPVFTKRNVSAFHRVDPIRTQEKATFFSDWVKVGMHQFDIEYDVLGNQFISDGALNKYYISEDRYGRRFLVTR